MTGELQGPAARGKAVFYHLTRSAPEATIAAILTRALAQGWNVMVRAGMRAGLEELDRHLWLVSDDGFLPHGLEGGPHDADQPVLLGQGAIANQARALVLLDNAAIDDGEALGLERIWVVFDGADETAIGDARQLWKRLIGLGLSGEYWSEETGRWEKKAERGPTSA